jgi:hypothetical protein
MSLIEIHQLSRDQEIQFPIALCPTLYGWVGCTYYLVIQISICYSSNWGCAKWTLKDERDLKAIAFLSYYKYFCLLIVWLSYSQNQETSVNHTLHNKIHKICIKFAHIRMIELHWYHVIKHKLSKLISNSLGP